MHEARNAGLLRRPRHGARAEGMHCLEILAAGFGENADEIDDGLRTVKRPRHRSRVAQIGLNRMDLADAAGGLQMESEIGTASANPDAPAALGKLAHDLPADEARTAEHRDDVAGRDQFFSHSVASCCCRPSRAISPQWK